MGVLDDILDIIGINPDPLPGQPNLPDPGAGGKKLDDVLRPDETHRMRLSEILRRGGWGPKDSITNTEARSVVACESGGKVDAISDNPSGGKNRGIFQIDDGSWEYDVNRMMEDPIYAAEIAHDIYDKHGWTKWACQPSAKNAPDPIIEWKSKRTATGVVDEVVDTITSPFEAVASLVSTLFQADTWLRIGKGILGFVLVIIGGLGLLYAGLDKAGRLKSAA